MVSVTHIQLGKTSKDNLEIDHWLASITNTRGKSEVEVIRQALKTAESAYGDAKRLSGEPYIQHALNVANTLNDLQLDHETIAAGLLHDVLLVNDDISLDELSTQFGPTIAAMVDGVSKMEMIGELYQSADLDGGKEKSALNLENLRKMLLAMAEDIRVVLIKLADRIDDMRTLSALPEEQQARISHETLELYSPLANRLGIWQLKWELEDLTFRYLEPKAYKKIAKLLDERRIEREQYIKDFTAALNEALEKAGIKGDVKGRPKHIYGIWRKMVNKHLDYDQIYDVRAARVLVDDIADCYTVLGIVHSLWKYVPGEFDDYIATPKENGYRSIHTAVIGAGGKSIEVQIRTHEMHHQNEYGVAAHWKYKEGAGHDESFERKIAWLRQLMEWKDDVANANDFVDQFKSDTFDDRIYVFTPTEQIIDLKKGATPLDFAYHIHSEVGHRCRGAKVNGTIATLTYELQTGDRVEILTIKSATPSRDWLNVHLGYLKTSRARSKVQHWFKLQDHDKNVVTGRHAFEREVKRMNFGAINQDNLAESLGFKDADEFFAAIARGDVKTSQYVNALQAMHVGQVADDSITKIPLRTNKMQPMGGDINVVGVGNLVTTMAKCCMPVPGDDIAGYITQGHGISIHRRDCNNVLNYIDTAPDRIIEVNWGTTEEATYDVDIFIKAFDRKGLLHDVTALLSNEKINLIAANTLSDSTSHEAKMKITIEINNINVLSRVLEKINLLPNIIEVRRLTH